MHVQLNNRLNELYSRSLFENKIHLSIIEAENFTLKFQRTDIHYTDISNYRLSLQSKKLNGFIS